MVGCRFPWVELGFNLEWYLKVFKAATGYPITFDEYYEVADRIYTLIRALWIRELGGWSVEMDIPPARWFKEPLTKGPIAGSKLDYEKYLWMLRKYYGKRGWDERGVPRESTLRRLKLEYTIQELSKYVNIQP
jgi:aldehyde:ferredoxin oxidoreductase